MKQNTRTLVGISIFTALVFALQLLGSFIRFGPFSISLVLVPIVIGGCVYGPFAGGWLGFCFGLAVLFSGDAASFFAVDILGTIITVMGKGILAGVGTAFVYRLLAKRTPVAAAFIAAALCPIINSGVFVIGCFCFFTSILKEWSAAGGFGENTFRYILLGMIGVNFLLELAANLLLAPTITRMIHQGKKMLSR